MSLPNRTLILMAGLLSVGSIFASQSDFCTGLPQQSGYAVSVIKSITPSHELNILMQYPNGHSYKVQYTTDQYGSVVYCVLNQDFSPNDPVANVTVTDQKSGQTYFTGEINYIDSIVSCSVDGSSPAGMSCSNVN